MIAIAGLSRFRNTTTPCLDHCWPVVENIVQAESGYAFVTVDTGRIMSVNGHWLDDIRWTKEGLVPVIVQDGNQGDVLMMAWMNREALELTVKEKCAVFWSRSRQRLWRKGEESGNVQRVEEIRLDCDGDALLLRVEQMGGIACHTGRRSCFYRTLQQSCWTSVEPILKDPRALYGNKPTASR
jgi:phosphoribosyl-AMP cyclohydrolase